MDQRLFHANGHRPHRLTNKDVPDLARAIVAYIRKQASLNKHYIHDVSCISFSGVGVDILVRADDWAKVVPLLKDGSLDPMVVPVSTVNIRARAGTSVLDTSDPLYKRTVELLSPLFPIDFP